MGVWSNGGPSAGVDYFNGDDSAETADGLGGDDNLSGGGGNDTLLGNTGKDSLLGGLGADRLEGGADDDLIYGFSSSNYADDRATDTLLGGAGDDRIYGGLRDIVDGGTNGTASGDTAILDFAEDRQGVVADIGQSAAGVVQNLAGGGSIVNVEKVYIYGGFGIDRVTGGAGIDYLYGRMGDDVFAGAGGSDNLYGDLHSDVLAGGEGGDYLQGGESSDVIRGDAGVDILLGDVTGIAAGAEGNDVLEGGAESDTLNAQLGDDLVNGGTGNDNLTGGAGRDVFIFNGAAQGNDTIVDFSRTEDLFDLGGAKFTSAVNNGSGTSLTYAGGQIFVSNIANVSLADWNARVLDAPITLTTGGEIKIATEAADIVYGAQGSDLLLGVGGDDRLYGGEGSDQLVGGFGDDLLDGGPGVDTVSYSTANAGVTIDLRLTSGQAGVGVDRLFSIENLVGSAFNDVLTGNELNNTIDGGGQGADVLDGGDGIDLVSYESSWTSVIVDLSVGSSWDGSVNDQLKNFESIAGSGYADALWGDAGANSIHGLDGDDLIDGGSGGADMLAGNGGVDTLSHRASARGVAANLQTGTSSDGVHTDSITQFENLIGSDFNDVLTGDANANTIQGLGGSDELHGAGGVDTLTYSLSARGVIVDMYAGSTWDGLHNDRISGFENLVGSAFDDDLRGDGGDNVLSGGTGGADALSGGGGVDTVSYASSARGAIIDLGAGSTWDGLVNDRLYGIENATGSSFNDDLRGDGGVNVLDGGAGDDRVDGGWGGGDTLIGGAGVDTLSYEYASRGVIVDMYANSSWDGEVNDLISGFENVRGSEHDDKLWGDGSDNVIDGGGGGADELLGGAGSDTLSYAMSRRGVIIDMYSGSTWDGLNNDRIAAFENLIGSAQDDDLRGDGADNVLDGGAGGADALSGGGGVDTVSYASSDRGVIIDIGAGSTWDGLVNDRLYGMENATGSAFNDDLRGDGGVNVLNGGAGDDRIDGGWGGGDTLIGGAGVDTLSYQYASRGVIVDMYANSSWDGEVNDLISGFEDIRGSAHGDKLWGDGGDNRIQGGLGGDELSGGGGADRFVYADAAESTAGAADRILEFNMGAGDLIDLSAIDADLNAAGDQAFAFASAFTGLAGQAVLAYDTGANTTTLSLDLNGDAQADFQLLVNGQLGTAAGWVL